MSAPKNIQRDALYIDLNPATRLTWGSLNDLDGTTAVVTTGSSVVYDYGSAIAREGVAFQDGKYTACGVAIQQPIGDRIPYRVKASSDRITTGSGSPLIIVGYTDENNTVGQNAPVEAVALIMFKGYFDDLIIMEPNPQAYLGRPLIFGVGYATSDNNFEVLAGQISVQNLGVKPPTMQNAVS